MEDPELRRRRRLLEDVDALQSRPPLSTGSSWPSRSAGRRMASSWVRPPRLKPTAATKEKEELMKGGTEKKKETVEKESVVDDDRKYLEGRTEKTKETVEKEDGVDAYRKLFFRTKERKRKMETRSVQGKRETESETGPVAVQVDLQDGEGECLVEKCFMVEERGKSLLTKVDIDFFVQRYPDPVSARKFLHTREPEPDPVGAVGVLEALHVHGEKLTLEDFSRASGCVARGDGKPRWRAGCGLALAAVEEFSSSICASQDPDCESAAAAERCVVVVVKHALALCGRAAMAGVVEALDGASAVLQSILDRGGGSGGGKVGRLVPLEDLFKFLEAVVDGEPCVGRVQATLRVLRCLRGNRYAAARECPLPSRLFPGILAVLDAAGRFCWCLDGGALERLLFRRLPKLGLQPGLATVQVLLSPALPSVTSKKAKALLNVLTSRMMRRGYLVRIWSLMLRRLMTHADSLDLNWALRQAMAESLCERPDAVASDVRLSIACTVAESTERLEQLGERRIPNRRKKVAIGLRLLAKGQERFGDAVAGDPVAVGPVLLVLRNLLEEKSLPSDAEKDVSPVVVQMWAKVVVRNFVDVYVRRQSSREAAALKEGGCGCVLSSVEESGVVTREMARCLRNAIWFMGFVDGSRQRCKLNDWTVPLFCLDSLASLERDSAAVCFSSKTVQFAFQAAIATARRNLYPDLAASTGMNLFSSFARRGGKGKGKGCDERFNMEPAMVEMVASLMAKPSASTFPCKQRAFCVLQLLEEMVKEGQQLRVEHFAVAMKSVTKENCFAVSLRVYLLALEAIEAGVCTVTDWGSFHSLQRDLVSRACVEMEGVRGERGVVDGVCTDRGGREGGGLEGVRRLRWTVSFLEGGGRGPSQERSKKFSAGSLHPSVVSAALQGLIALAEKKKIGGGELEDGNEGKREGENESGPRKEPRERKGGESGLTKSSDDSASAERKYEFQRETRTLAVALVLRCLQAGQEVSARTEVKLFSFLARLVSLTELEGPGRASHPMASDGLREAIEEELHQAIDEELRLALMYRQF
uniref:Uncharacterized protein n=1 Tax=Chromera velia CCMP2878 TaxID=1169474 RepID=A0A0G4IDY4_9ALVE|eukprot:Cvel_13546.t1-p1 / transcript=Cvel_13546.t1 / gene=Cvel_13546 / organism=Chromera_velia_CCMP2878 / gene_product=hypothetical protein / transcript_product=hypothetical protein / location=Cvel_scaffold930:24095-27217(+) / protein_length=1041 / sequence_SO=supercontig / SO=protein_coding / is_pseudo=false